MVKFNYNYYLLGLRGFIPRTHSKLHDLIQHNIQKVLQGIILQSYNLTTHPFYAVFGNTNELGNDGAPWQVWQSATKKE